VFVTLGIQHAKRKRYIVIWPYCHTASTLEVWIDNLLVEKACCYGCWGEIWKERLEVK